MSENNPNKMTPLCDILDAERRSETGGDASADELLAAIAMGRHEQHDLDRALKMAVCAGPSYGYISRVSSEQAVARVEALAAAGAGFGHLLVSRAADYGNAHVVRAICALGASVDELDSEGRCAMFSAAMGFGDKREVVKALAEAGADIGRVDIYGWTPLHAAAYKDSWGCYEELLLAGADPSAEESGGMTPIEYADSEHGVSDERTAWAAGLAESCSLRQHISQATSKPEPRRRSSSL